ncbi:hypothetical protein B0H65DRAFT_527732 [Neurospora tetraspora]|uniref:BTB domain-containing protein n=1 Tax=Neurospora tetraspora TaxID=94610 RepID=A0AAE0JDF4_9PEZI|nr:hypothetical protein B0H65DRAFT_527732 [Neurospora tetraspora]
MDNINFPAQPPNSPAESLGSISSEDAPSGDLVFLVGPAQEEILADLTGLREASSVFAEILAPYAMEMQGISYPGSGSGSGSGSPLPREISLPDDNDFAMKAIFYALAFPGEFIRPATPANPAPAGPSAREFLHLAVAIKKYKLQDNLFVPWARWFAEVVDKVKANGGTAQEMVWLVAAAWQLGERRRFAELGLDLMVKHQGRAGSFARLWAGDVVVLRVLPENFPLVGERAAQLKMRVLDLVRHRVADDGCGCGERAELTSSWEDVWEEHGWGSTVPLSELLRAVEPLAEQEAASVGEECDCGERELGPGAVKKELEKAKREAKICFECVEMGGAHSH